MNVSTLSEGLGVIAGYLGLDADALNAYAAEDTYGGFDFDLNNRRFDIGSIFGVEGQVLYALTRVLNPPEVVELGTMHGCGATHLLAALEANGKKTARLTSVDDNTNGVVLGHAIPDALRPRWKLVESSAAPYLTERKDNSLLLIFEDIDHSAERTAEIWVLAQAKLKSGGILISHDAEHSLVGAAVREGIARSGITDYLKVTIAPSDCGLAIWKKP